MDNRFKPGEPAPAELLIDVGRLERQYYEHAPQPVDPEHPETIVSFGTSGHRGTPLNGTFTEQHILAITQAICDYRKKEGFTGPLFLGKDTHAVSGPAQRTALEVLAGNEVETMVQPKDGFTPTPALSLAILNHNRRNRSHLSDGIGITPSHNPPSDGGFKYNPPNGGPADTDATDWIQARANALLREQNRDVKRLPWDKAIHAPTTHKHDFQRPYVEALDSVIDMKVIQEKGVKIGVDPLGGASVHYWEPIKTRYGLNLTVVNQAVDPTFRFMTLDRDGKIRMDCSSPYAMAGLVGLKDKFEVAFGNDPDADRHGIVTPSLGLMNPNHYLAVAIRYLLSHRPGWGRDLGIGKTVVSSSLIDRVVGHLDRELYEVPVGFKWFTPHLYRCGWCFAGEESAGATFLRMDGTTWTTDKDGLLLGLLAAEIAARTGKDPGQHYRELTEQFGTPYYRRIDAPASAEQRAAFKSLTPQSVTAAKLAGEPILAREIKAPGNQALIGGLKVVAPNGWFAARPSGTENLYKLYAESFISEAHLEAIIKEAQEIINAALARG